MHLRSRSLAKVLVTGIALLSGAVWLYFWWQRPPAVEFDNLKYIQLLRTAVSSQREDYVAGVERAVRQRHEQRVMSPAELSHFQAIITIARSGEWERAHRMAYDFEAAQAHRRRSRPRTDEP